MSSKFRGEVRSELMCSQETDIIQGSSRCEHKFFIHHSRSEDIRGPARDGASRRQSVIVKLSELSVIVKEHQ
jgi:hypothetical protein